MSDPALAVQDAVLTALRSSSPLRAIVAGRTWDTPPADGPRATTTFPYVSFGESRTEPAREDCFDGSTHTFTIYAWSKEVGWPECKRMAAAIRAALHNAELDVVGFELHDLALESTDYQRADDGARYAALTFVALLDPLE